MVLYPARTRQILFGSSTLDGFARGTYFSLSENARLHPTLTMDAQVANYPFTTRGITMGHIYVEGITYQVRSFVYPADKRPPTDRCMPFWNADCRHTWLAIPLRREPECDREAGDLHDGEDASCTSDIAWRGAVLVQF